MRPVYDERGTPLCRLPLAALVSVALVASACESDDLAPVSTFKPSACKPGEACGDEGVRLDAGFPAVGTDSGATTPGEDAGSSGGGDGGVELDGGGVAPSDGGALVPDAGFPPPPSEFLDLNGTWNTRYVFDLSAYLFGISNIADELDFIDQTFQGNISTGFPPLDAFIISIVQQYVPSWLVDLIDVLNTMATLFSETHVYGGRMTITQDPPLQPTDPSTVLRATETWSEFVLLFVSRCPRGRSDPNFPTCAEHRIPVTHNPQAVGPVNILVEVHPLAGVLQAGVPEADFVFQDREVDMEMQKLILLVVDFAVSLVTPYNNLRDALGAAVDCPGLGGRARDFAQNTLGLGLVASIGIGVAVEDQCNNVLDDLVDLVAGVGVTWEALDFDQHGHAIDRTPQDGLRKPEVLQSISVQDTIDGRFRFGIQDPLGGEWEGLP